MLIDYVNRLKELKQDRIKYQKGKDRTLYKEKLNKQQSKYQTYIIEQINQKNKLIAASKIQNILAAQVNNSTYYALHHIYRSHNQKAEDQLPLSHSADQTISVDFILVKLSTDVIKRLLTKAALQNVRSTFMEIQRFSKTKKILEKTKTTVQNYYLRHSFRKLILNNSKHLNHHAQQQAKIFDQSISLIYKSGEKEKKGIVGMSESYLSFMGDKQAYQQDNQSAHIIARQQRQIQSLQEDLSYLRSLLAEKNIQLKKKSQELNKLHQNQQHSYTSQNTSYCNSLQREVTGQKRIRKNNISQLSNSSPSLKGQQISRQLLSKYMKQSFQMKQTIDLARQLCLQVNSKLRPQLKKEMEGLIKLLTLAEDDPVIDQV